MENLETVIFDFDGVIADTEKISYQCYKNIINQYGNDLSLSEYVQIFAGRTEVENAKKLSSMYAIENAETVRNMYHKEEQKIMQEGVALKSGVKEILDYLSSCNIKICLATSSTLSRALNILKSHNIENYFDAFVTKEDVIAGKPNPEVFLKALEKTNTNAKNALVLEDSEFGIEAANAASIPVICVVDLKIPDTRHEAMTYKVCQNMLDVLKLIKN